LRHSNHLVTWSGSPPPLVVAAEALPDPEGGVRVDVSAPSGADVVVSDEGSVIDSVRINAWGASVLSPLAIGTVTARTGDQRATVAAPDSTRVRDVVVIGRAGWEGKFVVVGARESEVGRCGRVFSVAPSVDVTAGNALVLDTARTSAVVVIDTLVGVQASMLERFVRSGGGLVLAGSSGSLSALRSIAAGPVAARTRPVLRPTDTLRLGSTGFFPVASLNPGAVPLERRSEGVAVAARRVDAGARGADRLRRQLAMAHGGRAGIGARASRVVVASGELCGVRAGVGSACDANGSECRTARVSRRPARTSAHGSGDAGRTSSDRQTHSSRADYDFAHHRVGLAPSSRLR
jgi:hypothetical protein